MKKIVLNNCRITIREISEDVDILVGTYYVIFLIF